MMQKLTNIYSGQSGIKSVLFSRSRILRNRVVRKLVFVTGIIAVIIGVQMYLFYLNVAPQFVTANEQYTLLLDERHDRRLSRKISTTIDELRRISDADDWRRESELLQTEFQNFLVSPAEGMRKTLVHLSSLRNQAGNENLIINQLELDLIKIDEWHHDYYGDIMNDIIQPGIHLWPASILIKRIYGENMLDVVRFNRALYLIISGEGTSALATLGELRSQLPDSTLRAKVLYTEGRLLYGMDRYDRSIEIVQESIRVDPKLSLARRFLEYQLSQGPDEEVEEEDEGVNLLQFTSGGGGTLF